MDIGEIPRATIQQVILLVETDHKKALEAVDNYPKAIPDIVSIAPEKAIEIAEANPDKVLNVAGELARNKKFGIIMDLIERFPNYAEKIVAFNEKYGVDPVEAFLRAKNNSVRIAIAKTRLELLDKFVRACPDFKETASLLSTPKKKHHKRRLINSSLLSLIKPILKKHGRLFIATDWENYAEQIMELIARESGIINLAGENQYAPRPRWRPMTKFEKRGLNKGHRVFDFALAYKY